MTGAASGWNRFAGVPRPAAAAVLALLALMMVWGVAGGVGRDHIAVAGPVSARLDEAVDDHALYARIAERVAAGEPYYAAAADEHRRGNYPLRPFVTVRLPTLAYIVAALGERISMALFLLVGGAAIFAWYRRLRIEPGLPLAAAAVGALFVAANLSQLAARDWLYIHETGAGALLALALALYRPERPWATMAIVAAALAIRETLLPAAMLFGLFALIDRDWRAAAGWVAVGLAFAGGLAAHIAALAAVTSPADAASQGWNGQGGWAAYLSFVQATSALRFVPGWAALLVPVALLGWAAWRSRLGMAMLSIQLFYAALFMLFARPSNFYWAMLVVPTLFVGLVFAPAALAGLVRSLLHPPRLELARRSA
ncbi:hypothetical protein [Sphingopyxis sp. JAI128]|uniref:hypothetical protein n=1 Tax=Sphingopyxis sp. JAI128 TaxID=2723066 RepID=UPI00160914CE|nr:hypothetical protein [Sphingopyxis sp. JAI128]MBB6426588.1 hypothetical protein [Sphingopyxis sp. JAI128]